MPTSELGMLGHVATGFGLSYLLGFERQLRGSVAGDRTFAIVGTSAAAITSVVHGTSPQAVAGIVTGIGFIGAGVVFRGRFGGVHGVTTAATILAASAIGITVGYGDLLLGLLVTVALLLLLEIPQIPLLRVIDARSYASRFNDDPDLAQPGSQTGGSPAGDGPPQP